MANQQGNGRNVAVPDENRPSWRPQDENGPRNRRNMDEDDRYMRDRDSDRYMRDRDDDRYQRGGYWEDRSSRWGRDEGSRSTERYGMGQSGYGAGRYSEDRDYQSRNLGYPSHMEERARERGLDERYSQGRGGPSWSERDREYERGGRSGYGHGEYQPSGGYLGQSGQQMGWGNEGYMSRRGQHQEGGMYGHGPGSWTEGRPSYGSQSYGGMREYGDQGYGQEGRYGQQGGYGQGRSYGMQQRGYGGYGNYEQQAPEAGGRGVQSQGGMYGQGGYDEGMHGRGGEQHRYGSQGYQGWGQQPGGGRPQGMGYGQQGMQGREGMRGPSHRGKGPSGFTRSDERVREMVCEALENDHNVDATNIEVTVKNGEVTLSGTVDDRMQKRMAEDCVEQIAGVKDVQNQIRIATERKDTMKHGSSSGTSSTSTGKDTESSTQTASDKRPRA